jgi:hypothetical protein
MKLFTFIIGSLLSITATAQYHNDSILFLKPATASRLAQLPLKCAGKTWPYKTGIVFTDSSLTGAPQNYHPAFYGCFDWHSAVHGHWMMVRLLKKFSNLPEKEKILEVLRRHLTKENLQKELALFQSKDNKSFERTYGWAWLLQLQNDLLTWNHPEAAGFAAAMQPLASQLSANTVSFLKKLVYPIRAGEHTNLAFGLSLMYDYAVTASDTALKNGITGAAKRFYLNDKNAPLSWEPSGYDFLSPCLEEAGLMAKILSPGEYVVWLKKFLPSLFEANFTLAPGQVLDRTDGKLVHLDGLNLSRVWCCKNMIARLLMVTGQNRFMAMQAVGKLQLTIFNHLKAGLASVTSGDYAGDHWLASFAVYALTEQEREK